MAAPLPQYPPLPAWVQALLGDPESQALGLVQPLGVGAITNLGSGALRAVEYTAPDILPTLERVLGATPNALPLARAAASRQILDTLYEASAGKLEDLLRQVIAPRNPAWRGGSPVDEGVVGLFKRSAKSLLYKDQVPLWLLSQDPANGVPTTLAHELVHALHSRERGPLPASALPMIREYLTWDAVRAMPAIQEGPGVINPREVLAEVTARALTGYPYTVPGQARDVVERGLKDFLEYLLR